MNLSTTTILNAINQSRASQSLPPLKFNTTLSTFAQNKANDMQQKQYFSHVSPDGKKFSDFIDPTKYNYNYAGENLEVHYPDATSVEQAWMNSPTHRANIMSPNYQDIGIAKNGDFVVTFFGRQNQSSTQATSNPKPTTRPLASSTPGTPPTPAQRPTFIPMHVPLQTANSTPAFAKSPNQRVNLK